MPLENQRQKTSLPDVLNGEDKARIAECFEEEVVPKLKRLHARVGTLCCDFAGKPYRNWVIHFRSAGCGFEIVDFQYEEDAVSMDLDV